MLQMFVVSSTGLLSSVQNEGKIAFLEFPTILEILMLFIKFFYLLQPKFEWFTKSTVADVLCSVTSSDLRESWVWENWRFKQINSFL